MRIYRAEGILAPGEDWRDPATEPASIVRVAEPPASV
jgi:hypothetical protein